MLMVNAKTRKTNNAYMHGSYLTVYRKDGVDRVARNNRHVPSEESDCPLGGGEKR